MKKKSDKKLSVLRMKNLLHGIPMEFVQIEYEGKALEFQTTPVTQGQWLAVMGYNPSYFTGRIKNPVENISFYDAQEFIQRLNQKNDGYTYRLPTEQEWEYAARAGSQAKYSFGDDESQLQDYAWYSANSGSQTHEVATKKPNAFGLYDMHGNVWEWTGSLYSSGSSRVVRGGSWDHDARYARSANRRYSAPEDRWSFVGFRLLRTRSKEV